MDTQEAQNILSGLATVKGKEIEAINMAIAVLGQTYETQAVVLEEKYRNTITTLTNENEALHTANEDLRIENEELKT